MRNLNLSQELLNTFDKNFIKEGGKRVKGYYIFLL